METPAQYPCTAVENRPVTRTEHLLALLAAHRPLAPDGAAHIVRTVELVASHADPFDRHDLAPGHVTASAFVVSPDRARLLLIHHRRLQRWLQPGGHVEPADADVVAAARRELGEEAGIDSVDRLPEFPGLLDVDVHTIPGSADSDSHLHFDVRFLFRARSDAIRSGSDAVDVRWVPVDAIEEFAPGASMARVATRLRRGREATPTV